MKKQWKETGWNGILLKTPLEWEPGEIGRSYLLFEHNGLPVLELKWGKIKGRFSPRPVLRKLAPAKKLRRPGTFGRWSPPAPWQKALAAFQSYGFSWENPILNAKGLLLYCDFCKTATLIQFFLHRDVAAINDKVQLRILESLRDHSPDGKRLWSMYDIRAQVPELFELADFHFRTGQFMLNFKQGRKWLSLRRWSPATAVLSRLTLEAFAAENMMVSREGHKMLVRETEDAVEGAVVPTTAPFSGLAWLKQKLRRNHYQIWRVWRLPQYNRILAINLEDSQPVDTDLFDQIASTYGIVY